MEFRSFHMVETAEHIPIKVELAGLANRVFAFGIDGLNMLTLMGLWMLLFSLPTFLAGVPEIGRTAVPLGLFLIFFGYHLLQEWLWNGQTVGKRMFRIRVVRNNGQAIGFWESLGRNLLRVLDVYMWGIGLLCMMFNRQEKRFGDLLVGTIVINDQPVSKPLQAPLPEATTSTDALAVATLSAEEAEILKNFRYRRHRLFADSRIALADSLCRYFSERLHRPVAGEADLDALLEGYQAHVH